MKNLYVSIVALLLSGTAFAQLQTGTKFAGLHAGASVTKEDAFSKTTSYELAPTVGYFITKNIMIGIQGGYSNSVTEQIKQTPTAGGGFTSFTNMASDLKTTAYSAGVTARYYLPVVEKFSFFVESSAGYSRAKVELKYQAVQYYYETEPGQPAGSPWGTPVAGSYFTGSNTMKQSFLYGSIAPGMVYFPTPRIGVELRANMVNYLYSSDRGSQAEASFNLSKTNMGVGIYF